MGVAIIRRSPEDVDLKGRATMRSLLTLPSIALLGLGAGACGNAGRRAGSSAASANPATGTVVATAPAQSHLPIDSDSDNDNPTGSRYDSDDDPVLHFGRAASAADGRAIAALVR